MQTLTTNPNSRCQIVHGPTSIVSRQSHSFSDELFRDVHFDLLAVSHRFTYDKNVSCGFTLGVTRMQLIRQHRQAQGWSQQDLGDRVGCTKQHISDLEHGKVLPSLRLLHRLAVTLHIPDSELLLDSITDVSERARPPK